VLIIANAVHVVVIVVRLTRLILSLVGSWSNPGTSLTNSTIPRSPFSSVTSQRDKTCRLSVLIFSSVDTRQLRGNNCTSFVSHDVNNKLSIDQWDSLTSSVTSLLAEDDDWSGCWRAETSLISLAALTHKQLTTIKTFLSRCWSQSNQLITFKVAQFSFYDDHLVETIATAYNSTNFQFIIYDRLKPCKSRAWNTKYDFVVTVMTAIR